MEEGGGSNDSQGYQKLEREGSDVVCYAGLLFRSVNGGTDKETTKAAGL